MGVWRQAPGQASAAHYTGLCVYICPEEGAGIHIQLLLTLQRPVHLFETIGSECVPNCETLYTALSQMNELFYFFQTQPQPELFRVACFIPL